MKWFSFSRGVKLSDCKEIIKDIKIEDVKAPDVVIIPLTQHIGAASRPVVSKGDYVLAGQKIGEADGKVSANVHSSVSGKVADIKPAMTASGDMIESVFIENDGAYKEIEYKKNDYEKLKNEEIISLIRDAGIVGMGGAGFPTDLKLTPPKGITIDTIIVNGAECEPYLTCDHRLIMEEGDKIVSGLKILLKLFPNAKAYMAVEDDMKDAYDKLTQLTNGRGIEVNLLKSKYPQGAEKQLIHTVTGRTVPDGKLPFSVGCIVQNVSTVRKIYDAVVLSKPLTERIVTVNGDAIKYPKNLRVKIGTTFKDLIDACGGYRTEPAKIISGGPMMGMSVLTVNVPVTKCISGVVALSKKLCRFSEENVCIRCGACINGCPMGLKPTVLDNYSRRNMIDEFKEFGGMNCIECGCCTYACPSKRHLLQSIKRAKYLVRKNKQEVK